MKENVTKNIEEHEEACIGLQSFTQTSITINMFKYRHVYM